MLYKINLFYNNNSFDLFFECPEWKKYIKLVVFNKKFLKFFAKLPRPKYIPCVGRGGGRKATCTLCRLITTYYLYNTM